MIQFIIYIVLLIPFYQFLKVIFKNDPRLEWTTPEELAIVARYQTSLDGNSLPSEPTIEEK